MELIFDDNLCHKKPILTESFTLTETAALLECADLLISIDSMVIHLASAIKTPVIAIFGFLLKLVL